MKLNKLLKNLTEEKVDYRQYNILKKALENLKPAEDILIYDQYAKSYEERLIRNDILNICYNIVEAIPKELPEPQPYKEE